MLDAQLRSGFSLFPRLVPFVNLETVFDISGLSNGPLCEVLYKGQPLFCTSFGLNVILGSFTILVSRTHLRVFLCNFLQLSPVVSCPANAGYLSLSAIPAVFLPVKASNTLLHSVFESLSRQ